jgi:nicotinamidase-related amidase
VGNEALLVIDMLNDFILAGASLEVPDTRKVIPAIKKEIEKAHAEERPVIYVCDSHEPEDREFRKMGWAAHAVRGTRGAEVVEELKPRTDDIVIEKTTYSSFYHTSLDETLSSLNVDSVRLTGCVTHICIMFSAYEASLRGYDITVVKDCVAGLTADDDEAAYRFMENVMGVKIE